MEFFVRPTICQPLSDDSLHRLVSAHRIGKAKLRAVGIAEIKLRQVAMQMFLGAMLVDAFHAALKDRVVAAFNGIRGDIAARVLLLLG